ncbi:Acyl-CoA desaturase [Neolecta irregularis DAH-3]|uniref:Acyl-CoA desaturase n=1 Tax=Neolecta irregularis (strain DAH-3) TaxID=1198029 RepID=A0A1U7LGQ6_NEOID|nr:Acyl-CoA desaturase [Neolecta irregularis DAH-3]|eukprot:OLL21732.1 Acyl-CoA desaturase [Neolecta irregularis DAH-3]
MSMPTSASAAASTFAAGSSPSDDHIMLELNIANQPFTLTNWYKKMNWISTIALIFPPVFGIYGFFTTPIDSRTFLWSVIWYFCTGLGITAGYHRLWAHRSYSASWPLRLALMLCGTGAVEGSIRWWSAGHRSHHRWTDTEKDPYSIRKGFFHSHIGWMMFKSDPKKKGRTNISDLNQDPIVVFQHKHYLPLMIFMSVVFPTLVSGLGWGDYRGGYFYAGLLRLVFVHHATFCVNSLAHWIGDQPFDDRHSPRDHVLTAFITMGEGYHNFHHEFPADYRNAIKWYQYDPTKWLIRVCHFVGLAFGLKQFPENEIQKGVVQQKQKMLDRCRARIDWGIPLDQLPVMEFDDFNEMAEQQNLILIGGVIHDVTNFIGVHPGGKALMKSGIGKDMTAAFNGGVYDHSNAAHNLLSQMRVGVVRGGMEVEIWKRAQREDKNVDLVRDTNGVPIIRANAHATKIPSPGTLAPAS